MGQFPIYSHDERDIPSFHFIIAQLVIGGRAKQVEIARAFNIPPITIKRCVKKAKEGGLEAFTKPKHVGKGKGKRKSRVLTDEVKEKVQTQLDEGKNSVEIGKELGIKPTTIRKAIEKGQLQQEKKRHC